MQTVDNFAWRFDDLQHNGYFGTPGEGVGVVFSGGLMVEKVENIQKTVANPRNPYGSIQAVAEALGLHQTSQTYVIASLKMLQLFSKSSEKYKQSKAFPLLVPSIL